ncbi:HDL372Wp [Eremothecium sinecaudum]|uniref:HDL372Wp n=1 Tax=Eremothecium sinecaudum TaxID=45286 RepID=A0A120K245_9SACH|nr:HDL372Wp [Eremothecium sinecaudum]AMD20372.1 HDL372Wp [Eremothecium sinecaudum]
MTFNLLISLAKFWIVAQTLSIIIEHLKNSKYGPFRSKSVMSKDRRVGLPHLVKIVRSKELIKCSRDITLTIDMSERMQQIKKAYINQRKLPMLTSNTSDISDNDYDHILSIREASLRFSNKLETMAVDSDFEIPIAYFTNDEEIFAFTDAHEFQLQNEYSYITEDSFRRWQH